MEKEKDKDFPSFINALICGYNWIYQEQLDIVENTILTNQGTKEIRENWDYTVVDGNSEILLGSS